MLTEFALKVDEKLNSPKRKKAADKSTALIQTIISSH